MQPLAEPGALALEERRGAGRMRPERRPRHRDDLRRDQHRVRGRDLRAAIPRGDQELVAVVVADEAGCPVVRPDAERHGDAAHRGGVGTGRAPRRRLGRQVRRKAVQRLPDGERRHLDAGAADLGTGAQDEEVLRAQRVADRRQTSARVGSRSDIAERAADRIVETGDSASGSVAIAPPPDATSFGRPETAVMLCAEPSAAVRRRPRPRRSRRSSRVCTHWISDGWRGPLNRRPRIGEGRKAR